MSVEKGQLADSRSWSSSVHLLAAASLLLMGAAAHLFYLLHHCPLDLAGDEAHYWEWARHPALSYYSKGPLVAYIIAGSRWLLGAWSQRLLGNELLAVRLPALLLSVLTGLGIFVLAHRTLRSSRLALAAVALTFTVPIFAVGAMLMTIDAPLVFAWTWTLVFLHRAIERDSLVAWSAVGVCVALGILAKYTMVLIFPVIGLVLLTVPSRRDQWLRPGVYVALVLGLAGLVPILVWNAGHDWVSFRHVAGQAGLAGRSRVDLAGLAVYLGGQLGVVGLWLFGMVWAAVAFWREPSEGNTTGRSETSIRLLVAATLVPWTVFLPFSFVTKVQPNWPVVSLVGGTVLLVAWLDRQLHAATQYRRRLSRGYLAASVIVGASCVLVMHRTDWLYPLFARLTHDAAPWDLTPVSKYDPAARLRGWSQLGSTVGEVLEAERQAGRSPFILTDDYQVASEIAFYCPGQPLVYDVQSALGERMTQYDLWENPLRDRDRFVGRPCIYVGTLRAVLNKGLGSDPPVLPGLNRARSVVHSVRDLPVRVWTVYTCNAYAGFSPGFERKHAY